MTTAAGHAEGVNLHVTGNWRQAAKDHERQETREEALRPDSSQSVSARAYTDGDVAAVARAGRLGQHDEGTRRGRTFYALVSAVGRRARGARGTRRALPAHATDMLVRLASGTLSTLSAVEQQHGNDPARIKAKIKEWPRGLQFASAGLSSQQGADGPEDAWSAACPLCCGGEMDDQAHFVSCEATQVLWRREVKAAVGRAVEGSRCAGQLRLENKIEEVQDALVAHLLSPGAHYLRRCGLGFEGHTKDAYKAVFGAGMPVPNPRDLMKNLRLELLVAASSAFHFRKVLFTGLNGLAHHFSEQGD